MSEITLASFLDEAWALLAFLPRESVVATIGAEGPEQRVVMLRRADRGAACLSFFSDAFAAKTAEIAATPAAGLLVWDRRAGLHLRLSGRAALATDLAADWAALPPEQHLHYGMQPAPGTPIDRPDAWRRMPDPAAFARIDLHLSAIEVLRLTPKVERAHYRAPHWHGGWIAP